MKKRILKIFVALVVAIFVASTLNSLLAYRIKRWASINAGKYYEYSGVVNLQTTYSSGIATYHEIEKMCDSLSLHFVIISDINTTGPMRQNLSHRFGMTLVVPGVEIAASNTSGRYLVIGDSIPLLPGGKVTLDAALQDAADKGDLVVLAQPYDVSGDALTNYSRTKSITGMELYNSDQAWRSTLSPLLINKFIGGYFFYGFDTEVLNYWLAYPSQQMKAFDFLNTRRKIVGIGSIGASGITRIGKDSNWHFPTYQSLLDLVHTVIVTKVPFNGLYHHDRAILLNAIRNGNDFVAFSGLEHARGFLFTAKSDTSEAILGDSLRLVDHAVLDVAIPDSQNVETQIVRDGKIIATYKNKGTVALQVNSPGEYRVQVFQKRTMLPFFLSRSFPWILSNPIYIFR